MFSSVGRGQMSLSPKAETMDSDQIEQNVLAKIPTLDAQQLEEVCGVITLDVPAEIKGDKRKLRKLLTKDLMKDSEDDNLATMMLIMNHLSPEKKEEDQLPKTEDNTSIPSTSAEKKKSDSIGTVVDPTRFKELKISGVIGGKREEGNMTYTSLTYQVNNARKLMYPETVICAGIIKAIDPSNQARTYLESSPDLSLDVVLEFLQSHCREAEDSGAVFTSFQNAHQRGDQSAKDFVTGLMVLRKKVLDLSVEEGTPYEERMLRKRFFHVMFTGLRSESVRSELREKIREDWTVPDQKLLKMVATVSANEAERKEKLGGIAKKTDVDVNAISEKKNQTKEKKKDNPFVRIEELLLKQDKEMKEMKAQILELKSTTPAMTSAATPGPQVQRTAPLNVNASPFQGDQNQFQGNQNRFQQQAQENRRRPKRRGECNTCWQQNAQRCPHCLVCGSTDHRVAACPVRGQGNLNE